MRQRQFVALGDGPLFDVKSANAQDPQQRMERVASRFAQHLRSEALARHLCVEFNCNIQIMAQAEAP